MGCHYPHVSILFIDVLPSFHLGGKSRLYWQVVLALHAACLKVTIFKRLGACSELHRQVGLRLYGSLLLFHVTVSGLSRAPRRLHNTFCCFVHVSAMMGLLFCSRCLVCPSYGFVAPLNAELSPHRGYVRRNSNTQLAICAFMCICSGTANMGLIPISSLGLM